ncbi:MAG: pyridoxal 5'-phosphate synthase glutaminase subunit PdxT [Pleomorphochaeta sp.]
MNIGVLSLQGAFIEHRKMLEDLGVTTFEIRQLKDLNQEFDGLVLPGGESTVQINLLKKIGLLDPLKDKINKGMPVLATCAGLILLAQNVQQGYEKAFNSLPVTVKRNAYGRQLGSFVTTQDIKGIGNFEMIFIRAPYIEKVDDGVEILAQVDNKIVGVRYKNQLALAFHPELSNDKSIHKYFLSMIK